MKSLKKKRFLINIALTVLVFVLTGLVLYRIQQKEYRDMEDLAIERTEKSIGDSLSEFHENLEDLYGSYSADLTGRAGTVALMLKEGKEEQILREAKEICKADRLFVADENGMITFSATDGLTGKPAEEVLSEFTAAEDQAVLDHVSVSLPDGCTLWLCDHASALLEMENDPSDFLELGNDLNAFNAGSARIILWSIALLGISMVILCTYGEYLTGKGIRGGDFRRKSFKISLILLLVIGIASFYTQTLECISSAIDTADNTGEVLTEIRAQHITNTDYLDSYYEDHDQRRINLIAFCIENALAETKEGTEHVYREEAAGGLRKPLKNAEGKEIISYSENPLLKDLLLVNGLDEIFLTDKNGFTVSSGSENWYYRATEVPGFTDVLDGRISFYNDEHNEEGYRLNAAPCGDGILVIRRPWVSEDKNIRMRKEFIYDAAEASMNAVLVQASEEEEQEESTNSFIEEDGIQYFRHRITARSLNEGNYLIALYRNDFVFRTRRSMIWATILLSAISMTLLILLYSFGKREEGEKGTVGRTRMDAVFSVCLLLALLLILSYLLQGVLGGESISAIRYIMKGDWPRGFNFFSLSACAGTVFGAFLLQQLGRYLLRIGSSDLETYKKERFEFASLILSILIFLAALFSCLYNMGLNLSGLFASAGILSAIVGIASQNMIGNYFDGIKNMYDDTYRVGEWVLFQDFRGKIVDMNATYLKIEDSKGNIMKVNHRDFVNAVNLSRNASVATITIPVSVTADLSVIRDVLKAGIPGMPESLRQKMIGDPVLLGVSSTDGDGQDLLFSAYVNEEDMNIVKLMLAEELIGILNRAGIESPTPVMKVLNG